MVILQIEVINKVTHISTCVLSILLKWNGPPHRLFKTRIIYTIKQDICYFDLLLDSSEYVLNCAVSISWSKEAMSRSLRNTGQPTKRILNVSIFQILH